MFKTTQEEFCVLKWSRECEYQYPDVYGGLRVLYLVNMGPTFFFLYHCGRVDRGAEFFYYYLAAVRDQGIRSHKQLGNEDCADL